MGELKEVIEAMQPERAPGPDGFPGIFFKICWDTIKFDLMRALNMLHSLKADHWDLLNSANIVLIPKKDSPSSPLDYRPISLMHNVAKILCKLLANRLAPELNEMVSHCQSAFIKKRCIQDNFLYVQNVIKAAHAKKKAMIFLKLDIAKAFDSVGWGYLLQTLAAFGFGHRWRNLISIILSSSSSRILLNGAPGSPFKHMCGLRQGDPLSPMLFILAMEPLQRLFELASDHAILTKLGPQAATLRTSMYADDAALFLNPDKHGIAAAKAILNIFGEASGLKINVQKCTAFPIRCENLDFADIMQDFGGATGTLPCRYLGLPLSLRKPRRVEVLPLIEGMAGRLKGWKGKLMAKPGRLALINSVLTSMATYFLTRFAASKWAIKRLDKIRRNFLWAADEECNGGKCLVNWKKCCSPKKIGGLGIKDIACFGRALRLRWAWLEWSETPRPWMGKPIPCDRNDL